MSEITFRIVCVLSDRVVGKKFTRESVQGIVFEPRDVAVGIRPGHQAAVAIPGPPEDDALGPFSFTIAAQLSARVLQRSSGAHLASPPLEAIIEVLDTATGSS